MATPAGNTCKVLPSYGYPDGVQPRLYRAVDCAALRAAGGPGDIEQALLGLGLYKEVAVIGCPDTHGEQRLIAYLVPVRQPGSTVTALRRRLAQMLPDYMIPAAFVLVDALPLTPTGKVDRGA
jgi:acyl-coenzyme A synthetase/AMP-(fatty) acid ligase